MKKILLVILSSLNFLLSQSVSLEGIITDKSTGDVLIGANVFIVGTSIGTATTNNGKYKITKLNPGRYMLKATYMG